MKEDRFIVVTVADSVEAPLSGKYHKPSGNATKRGRGRERELKKKKGGKTLELSQ